MEARHHYGSVGLFAQIKAFNQRRNALEEKLNVKNELLSFSLCMTGRLFTLSAGFFCLTAIFALAIPALISLAVMHLYDPQPVTFDSIELPTYSENNEIIYRRDVALLWAALALALAAGLAMLLYCMMGPCHKRIRGEKNNVDTLSRELLRSVPHLKENDNENDTVEMLDAGIKMLALVELKYNTLYAQAVTTQKESLPLLDRRSISL